MNGIPGLTNVDHVAITIPDLNAAVKFYTEIIGGVELFRRDTVDSADLPRLPDGRDFTDGYLNVPGARFTFAVLQIGSNLTLELFQYHKPPSRHPTPPRNNDLGGHHMAFKVANIEKAVAYLLAQGVQLMTGPGQELTGPNAGVKFIYFLDPWGNQLELIEYDRLPFETTAGAKIYRPG